MVGNEEGRFGGMACESSQMYRNVSSKIRVGETYNYAFCVKTGVCQGNALSPLLFIIVDH